MESDSARAYRIDPGGELLELGGAGAEVVGDAAGDEEAQGSGEAVADGADQAQRHQRPSTRSACTNTDMVMGAAAASDFFEDKE